MTRRPGWRKQPADVRDIPYARFGAAVLPTAHALPAVDVRDQGRTASCTGQGTTNAVRTAYLAAGLPCPPLSALAAYSWGRALEGNGADRRDEGAYIRNVIKAVQKLGAADETSWPFEEPRVNDHPTGTALWSAYDRKGVRGYYAIPVPAAGVVRAAIAAGHPVVAGWGIGDAFQQYDGEGVMGVEALGADGHCMMIGAYEADGSFDILNSWGPDWGLAGHARVSAAFVESADDMWVIVT